jgi:hypothetical protein
MPLGLKPGQVLAVVREARATETRTERVAIAGPGASELARSLAEGGDAGAVVVGDAVGAAVAIRIVEGGPSAAETAALRAATRAGTPLVVVRRGTEPIPYVLPNDIVEAPDEIPVDGVAAAVARVAPDAAPVLAARLPALRPAAQRRVIDRAAWGNALVAASTRDTGPQLPLLAMVQSRMLLLLAASRGERLPSDPKALAAAAGPPIAASLALGLAARELVRRLPAGGRLARGTVAFAGTRLLGEARLRLP